MDEDKLMEEHKLGQEQMYHVDLKWNIESSAPLLWANQFALTQVGEDLILSCGHFTPILVKRSQQEVEEYLKSATVTPAVRIIMSRESFQSLFELFARNIEKVSQLNQDSNNE